MSALEFDETYWVADKDELRKKVIDESILRTKTLQDRVGKHEIDLNSIPNHEYIKVNQYRANVSKSGYKIKDVVDGPINLINDNISNVDLHDGMIFEVEIDLNVKNDVN